MLNGSVNFKFRDRTVLMHKLCPSPTITGTKRMSGLPLPGLVLVQYGQVSVTGTYSLVVSAQIVSF